MTENNKSDSEPVAWTNEAQLGFLKESKYDGIPMAMWSKPTGSGQIPLYTGIPTDAQSVQVTDAMVEAGAIGLMKDVAEHDEGPSFYDASEQSRSEAKAMSRECLTAALASQPSPASTVEEDDASYERGFKAGYEVATGQKGPLPHSSDDNAVDALNALDSCEEADITSLLEQLNHNPTIEAYRRKVKAFRSQIIQLAAQSRDQVMTEKTKVLCQCLKCKCEEAWHEEISYRLARLECCNCGAVWWAES